ncbi:MAG: protein translocase subunit SecD, partial [Candidatus Brocadiia bacterium]
MDKNLTWKIVLIAVSVLLAAFILYPPGKTLKPGIDLAGGTSLIYEIDTQDVSANDKRNLSEDVITILRRRIDPANIQNLIWRPQGNTRFEIQMPLASAEAREKRQNFENVKQQLLDENTNPAIILRALKLPKEKRDQEFTKLAKGVQTRVNILNTLAEVYDLRLQLQTNRDSFNEQIKALETKISEAGLDIEKVRTNAIQWAKLDPNSLTNTIANFDSLNLTLLAEYTKVHAQWASVVDQLADPQEGINIKFEAAKQALNKLSLTEDQLTLYLDKPEDSAQRKTDIENLKKEFSDRADLIAKVFTAYDLYRPFRGGLDDPKDLQRMLKGAGILEFRILPTMNNTEVDQEEMMAYVQNLKEKGPRFSSSNTYKWFEIDSDKTEEINSWIYSIKAVVGQFGDKFYVLASNKSEETMLHNDPARDWKLKDARPDTDYQTGQRAIGFQLDDRGGMLFSKLSGANVGRPLCIILDNIAISAPTLRSRIGSSGQISGSFTEIERTNMVKKLKAGSLPAKLIEQPISIKTIGPSIGADNRDKGIKSGVIGLAVVVFVMLIYYAIAGAIANVALFINLLFILAIMALVKATFTLPGIAGMILTIGMSVDANVLIYERIREEQAKGASLRIAIRNGYQRAFRTILDANLTTFITAFILFWVASEEIKGFAIVLMLGIASSMFTALFVTRVIFDLLLNAKILKEHLSMLHLIKSPNVDWMKFRPVFLTISSILVILGLIVFFTRDNTKNNKYDIIFMDIKMPVLDGYEASKEIRKTDTSVPIVAMTANAIRGDYEKCIEVGMNDYLSKPIDIEKFSEAINRNIQSQLTTNGGESCENNLPQLAQDNLPPAGAVTQYQGQEEVHTDQADEVFDHARFVKNTFSNNKLANNIIKILFE